MFILCTTLESVQEAIDVLTSAEYVILDCEGRNLGSSTGALSIVSLGTPQLLFSSVLSLTPHARTQTKVVWDGRMDYAELFFSYTCPIENVLDLQLVDVLSREKRGLDEWNRICRFARKKFPMSEVKKLQLEEVHVLNGMDSAADEHGIKGVDSKNKSVKKLHTDNLSEIWMQRPLSTELLEYAAIDIVRIAAIHDHFVQHGYLQPMEILRELSAAYVSMHRQTGKPNQENIFLTGPYLPLSIDLAHNQIQGGSAPMKECARCERSIYERHFPFEAGIVIPKKSKRGTHRGTFAGVVEDLAGKLGSRLVSCKVCTLVLAKTEYSKKISAEKDKTTVTE